MSLITDYLTERRVPASRRLDMYLVHAVLEDPAAPAGHRGRACSTSGR
jgi:hypothetical protein